MPIFGGGGGLTKAILPTYLSTKLSITVAFYNVMPAASSDKTAPSQSVSYFVVCAVIL